MRSLFLLLFVSLHISAYSQTESINTNIKLKIIIVCAIADGNYSGFTVSLKKGNELIETLSEPRKAEFELDGNSGYTIMLHKSGYITKEVSVNTFNVPASVWDEGLDPIESKIELQPQPENKTIKFIGPICYWSYKMEADNFSYEVNYEKYEISNIPFKIKTNELYGMWYIQDYVGSDTIIFTRSSAPFNSRSTITIHKNKNFVHIAQAPCGNASVAFLETTGKWSINKEAQILKTTIPIDYGGMNYKILGLTTESMVLLRQ